MNTKVLGLFRKSKRHKGRLKSDYVYIKYVDNSKTYFLKVGRINTIYVKSVKFPICFTGML